MSVSYLTGKVAVILTAMDPNQMPAALLRANRVELWLETKLPDARARQEILESNLAKLLERLGSYDAERVKAATNGFNAADISRVVADVKALYAADVIRDVKPATLDSYFAELLQNPPHQGADCLCPGRHARNLRAARQFLRS